MALASRLEAHLKARSRRRRADTDKAYALELETAIDPSEVLEVLRTHNVFDVEDTQHLIKLLLCDHVLLCDERVSKGIVDLLFQAWVRWRDPQAHEWVLHALTHALSSATIPSAAVSPVIHMLDRFGCTWDAIVDTMVHSSTAARERDREAVARVFSVAGGELYEAMDDPRTLRTVLLKDSREISTPQAAAEYAQEWLRLSQVKEWPLSGMVIVYTMEVLIEARHRLVLGAATRCLGDGACLGRLSNLLPGVTSTVQLLARHSCISTGFLPTLSLVQPNVSWEMLYMYSWWVSGAIFHFLSSGIVAEVLSFLSIAFDMSATDLSPCLSLLLEYCTAPVSLESLKAHTPRGYSWVYILTHCMPHLPGSRLDMFTQPGMDPLLAEVSHNYTIMYGSTHASFVQ